MIDCEQYRIKDGKQYNCIVCFRPAVYDYHSFTFCEGHKEKIREDPEDLEHLIFDALKQLSDEE